jgi:hypothetical protein
MLSRGFKHKNAKYVLAEQSNNVFVVAVQLYDPHTGNDIETLPNNVRFFARIVESLEGTAYVDLGDFGALIPFDSVAKARQHIHVLYELEQD